MEKSQIGYTYQNNAHYYEGEEGLDRQEPESKDSEVAQLVMASYAQLMADHEWPTTNQY